MIVILEVIILIKNEHLIFCKCCYFFIMVVRDLGKKGLFVNNYFLIIKETVIYFFIYYF